MPAEIHRGVKDSNDLQDFSVDAKQDYMLALRRDLAACKEVISKSPPFWIRQNFLEPCSKGIEVFLFLSFTPDLQRVISNRLQIADRRFGEIDRH